MFETIHHCVIICCFSPTFFCYYMSCFIVYYGLLYFLIFYSSFRLHFTFSSSCFCFTFIIIVLSFLTSFFIIVVIFFLHIRVFFNSPVYYTHTFKLISNVFIVVSMKKTGKKTITMFDNLFSLNVFLYAFLHF